jgi:GTPase Era involved in 16S rRNA processing
LERFFGTRIYLGLHVKVAPDWRENPRKVRELDWRHQLEGLGEAKDPEE